MAIISQLQGVLLHRIRTPLTLFLGAVLGGALGYSYVHTESPPLVMPTQPNPLRGQQLSAQLQIPDHQEHLDELKKHPIWQLTPDGKELNAVAAPSNAPTVQTQRWLLVGRVQRPDGPALVFYQPETQISKAYKENENLPDGRKLIKIEATEFILGTTKGKRRTERLAYSAGLSMDAADPAPVVGKTPP